MSWGSSQMVLIQILFIQVQYLPEPYPCLWSERSFFLLSNPYDPALLKPSLSSNLAEADGYKLPTFFQHLFSLTDRSP